jgi:hypothetical protein
VPVSVGNGGSVEPERMEECGCSVKTRVEGCAGGGKNDSSEIGMRLIVAFTPRLAFVRLGSSEGSRGSLRRDVDDGSAPAASPVTV